MAKRTQKILTVAVITAGVVAATAFQPAAAASLKGKDIAVLVGFPPGSSATLVVRTFAPFWTKHTPGNPNFVVKNLPGAGRFQSCQFPF